MLPVLVAASYHTVNNYVVQKPTGQAAHWLDHLNGKAWAAPLVCLAIAMAFDLRRLHRGKRALPGVLLASERTDGDSLAALLRYAAWRPPWSLRGVLRYVALRRSLFYAVASAPHDGAGELSRVVTGITDQMDASDDQQSWRTLDIRSLLKAARAAGDNGRRWLALIPCVLVLPSLLFLGVGSFTSTARLQKFFSTGSGPRILMGFGAAALVWIAYQLATLWRTWRTAAAQPVGEVLAVHRFRFGTAQMWLDGGTDVFVRVRRLRGSAAAVEFGLDGLGASQGSVVLAVAHAVRQTWKDCLGLVVDRFGGTEDTDWDAVVLHGEPDVVRMPDILAVRHDTAARNARLAGLDSRSVPPLLVYGDAAHLFA